VDNSTAGVWPKYSAAAATDTPRDSSVEANVCRLSWIRALGNPARRRIVRQTYPKRAWATARPVGPCRTRPWSPTVQLDVAGQPLDHRVSQRHRAVGPLRLGGPHRIALFEAHGWVRQRPQPRPRGGRPPSPIHDVNPPVYDVNPQLTQETRAQ
jgi:hypothetical protein